MAFRKIDPYYTILALLVIVLVAFKWKSLDLPLYWDEAWVYGPAVRAMDTNGLSLLPNTIGTELSRGHPLLFHFMAALWTGCFGATNTSLHAFALTLSIALLITIFHVGKYLGSPLIGLAAVFITGSNEIFLAQTSILLPEIALALFSLLAVWAFITNKWIAYVFTATCALLVKESAIVLIIAAFCWNLVSYILDRGKNGLSRPLKWSLVALAPILPGVLFLLYQKITYGWYFFPVHLGLISWDIKDIHFLFKFGYRELFEQQGMEWATLAFGLVAPLVWRGWKHRYMGILVSFLYVAAIKVLDGKWTLAPLPTLIVTFICFGAILLLQFIPIQRKETRTGRFASLSLIFTLGFLLFSALNFFSDRYLLCLIPIIALSFSAVLFISLNKWHKALFPTCVAMITIILISNIGKDGHVGDTRLSYADDIHVHEQLIQTCEAMGLQDTTIFGSFMDGVYMSDPTAGYLNGQKPFQRITLTLGPEVSFALVTQATPQQTIDKIKAGGFERVKRFASGPAWGELYRHSSD